MGGVNLLPFPGSRGFANVREAAAARWALNGRVFSPSIHVG